MATLATYKTLMKVYACCNQYESACVLYFQALEDGVVPDTVMCGCLAKFASKCGRSDVLQAILKSSGAGSSSQICSLRAAGTAGDLDLAFQLLRDIQQEAPEMDISLCNCVMDACVMHRRLDR